MTPTSLYIHLPFCASKCAYCDFNSVVAGERVRAGYLQALRREIQRTGSSCNERLFTTIYFGGGTPTLYESERLCQLLADLRGAYRIVPEAEVTIEANPGTVTPEGLAILREMGFNRLSLGVQSLDTSELSLLGRRHTAQQAREAVAAARAAGFDNLSVDLINCLPGQTVESWRRTLDGAIFWLPEHLSCYGLAIEEGTPLARRMARGRLQACDEMAAAQIYEETHWTLTEAGYEHYEISNYARVGERSVPGEAAQLLRRGLTPDRGSGRVGTDPISNDHGNGPPMHRGGNGASPRCRCRHNENYWRHGEYVGLGAGATSYLNGHRLKSEPDPVKWTERVLAGLPPGLAHKEALNDRQQALEVLMLALRTSDGLDLPAFCREFGLEQERYELRLRALMEARLAEPERDRLVLTPIDGFLLHSEIVQMFM